MAKTFYTPLLTPPGIGTGAAYAALDALGTMFPITVPQSGILQTAFYYDLSAQGLQVDLLLFNEPISAQTDNGALTLSDGDAVRLVGRLSFTSFLNATSNQISDLSNIGKAYVAPQRVLWGQVVAQGAITVAAGNLPMFRLVILPDD